MMGGDRRGRKGRGRGKEGGIGSRSGVREDERRGRGSYVLWDIDVGGLILCQCDYRFRDNDCGE